MKLTKKYNLLTNTKLEEVERKYFEDGFNAGQKDAKSRIESLENGLERKDKQVAKLRTHIEELEEAIDVYKEERDKVRNVIKQKIINDDLAAELEAREEGLDERDAGINNRMRLLESKEDGKYKEGYADGSADMARKIGDITQKDRDSAMQIAMVSAASHTPVENIKELNNVHQLTTGTTNS